MRAAGGFGRGEAGDGLDREIDVGGCGGEDPGSIGLGYEGIAGFRFGGEGAGGGEGGGAGAEGSAG